MSDLLLATANRGKQREFGRLLASVPGRLVLPQEIGLDLDVPEPLRHLRRERAAKAEAYGRASGLLTLADDSGIEVAALDWGPGVAPLASAGRTWRTGSGCCSTRSAIRRIARRAWSAAGPGDPGAGRWPAGDRAVLRRH